MGDRHYGPADATARKRWLSNIGRAAGALVVLSLLPAATGAVAVADVGRDVYVETCAACHARGAGHAPRVGSRVEWNERLLAGREALLRSVLKGKGGMPPKGGNASLSDSQARAALDHLLSRIAN